jgi:tetratricopeptide (TPR) repeat protein
VLGNVGLAEEVISEKQLKESLKEMEDKSDGFPLGMTLVNKGLLDPQKLMQLLEKQLLQRLYELFTWTEGSIKLHPHGKKSAPEPVPLSYKTPAIILQGLILAAEKAGKFKNFSPMRYPKLVESAVLKLEDFQFSGTQTAFLRQVRGDRNISDLCQESKLKLEEAKGLMYALELIGLVSFTDNSTVNVAQHNPNVELQSKPATTSTPSSKSTNVEPQDELGLQLEKRLKEAEKQNYFELLGIGKDASDAEIRKVYFKLAKDFHPDRLRNISNEQSRRNGELLFGRMSEAYNTLVDSKKREEYVAGVTMGMDSNDATEKAGKILESEALFQRARNIVKQGDLRKAKELLDKAIELHADEPEYQLYLGWCLYKLGVSEKNSANAQKGKKLIEQHKEARKNLDSGYYFLAEIALIENNLNQAIQLFNKVLEINPKSHEAERQLRLIEMRREKKESGGKGLMGMFKKDSK